MCVCFITRAEFNNATWGVYETGICGFERLGNTPLVALGEPGADKNEFTIRNDSPSIRAVQIAGWDFKTGDQTRMSHHDKARPAPSARQLAEVEQALHESQQLLASVTTNIAEAIFRRSLTEGLLFLNEAYVKMFGYSSAVEVRRVPPEQLYAEPDRREAVVRALERDGYLRNEEIEYRRRDGSTFWGLTPASAIKSPVAFFILTARSTTSPNASRRRKSSSNSTRNWKSGSANARRN